MPRTHKSLQRLYVEESLASGQVLALSKDHTNYLINVLRKRAGEPVIVFNGRDGAFLAQIEQVGKKQVNLVLDECVVPQPPASDLWYGFAPLKTGRLDYMIQKATEMGVGTIQPVMTAFTQNTRLRHDKMRANTIEAAEQCEVLSVPQIADETALEKLIATWTENHGTRQLIFADEAAPSGGAIAALRSLEGNPVGVIVGPEGGFSEKERELLLAQPFVTPISLGPRILRADTAAVAVLALVQSIIGDWR